MTLLFLKDESGRGNVPCFSFRHNELTNNKRREIKLTLHWKIENHKRITLEILDKMKRIQKMESK